MYILMGTLAALPMDFKSIMGTVKVGDLLSSLWLLLQGMVGIFIVMLIIFLVVVVLGKVTGKRKDEKNNN